LSSGSIVGSRSAVPDDIKADIARVVRSINSSARSAASLLGAVIGFITLGPLGFKPQFCVGGMLYRAGPDRLRDTVPFRGPGNAGRLIDGQFVGHVWLRLDDELVDWPHLDPRGELPVAGIELPPVRWQAPPPTFVWATRDLFDWQPHGEPPIGEMWYGPRMGIRPDHFVDTLTRVEPLYATVVLNLVRVELPDRLRKLAMAA
jgi:hypothetical protein